MKSSIGRITAPILLWVCLASLPAHSLTRLQGRLSGDSKQDGAFDFIIQVWDKPYADGKDKLILSIQVPKVSVVGGGFDILLDVGLNAGVEANLSYRIEGRRFESLTPFQPAEVSRVLSGNAALSSSSELALR